MPATIGLQGQQPQHNQGFCEEASMHSTATYVPCGALANSAVYHKREDTTYAMCPGCAQHNVHNRGATLLSVVPEPAAAPQAATPKVSIEDIIKKYIELRDRKAEKAKRRAEEDAPENEAMGTIENYLMHQMNTMGCDSLKANGVGTAFKATSTSCQLQDALTFKEFVFTPATDGIVNYLRSTGYGLRDIDIGAIANIIRDLPKWDMVDFRAGKKGITEYIANENLPVPGVAINTVATVNIRRA